MFKEYIRQAVELAGSQTALAQACGVKQQHVWNWLNRDKSIPAKYALLIEEATAGAVKRYQLCPDIFPPPKEWRVKTSS